MPVVYGKPFLIFAVQCPYALRAHFFPDIGRQYARLVGTFAYEIVKPTPLVELDFPADTFGSGIARMVEMEISLENMNLVVPIFLETISLAHHLIFKD